MTVFPLFYLLFVHILFYFLDLFNELGPLEMIDGKGKQEHYWTLLDLEGNVFKISLLCII